jgi:formylglycine-generating enzyme required for sulfatase activity
MKIIRQKQKPFFSTLEEIELDILAREKKKEDLPFEREPTEPEGILAEPKRILTEPERVLTEPERILTEPKRVLLAEPERVLLAEPERSLTETIVEPIIVQPSAAVVTDSPRKLSRKIGASIADAPFVYILPNTFIMGSPELEPGRGSDEMQHEVTLTRGYFIQTTPVTQKQWQEVMGSNPSNFLEGGEDCPVEGVSLNDCLEFIWRVNNKRNYPYRLPTEAEWEYACRAGSKTSFFNGEITEQLSWRFDPCLDTIGWYCGNSGNKTRPIGEKQPNAWGLYDMHGNVCEWCNDQYGEYHLAPQFDPKGVTLGQGCVARGGSWLSESRECRAASRFCYSPNFRCNFVGFRLVREP